MAARTLPGLGLTGYWVLGSNAWKDANDVNLLKLSVFAGGKVKSQSTALPGSPTLGDIYIVRDGDANEKQVAVWDGETGSETWTYFPAQQGWAFYVEDTQINMQYDGTDWLEFAGAGGGGGGGGAVYVGAKISLLADDVDVDATTAQPINLDEVLWDDGGFFAAGTPGRVTVVAGVTKVRVAGFLNLETVGASSYTRLFIRHYDNLDVSQGVVAMTRQEAGSDAREMMAGADVKVNTGDYFVLELFTESDTTVTVEQESFLSIQAIDGSAISADAPSIREITATGSLVEGDLNNIVHTNVATANDLTLEPDLGLGGEVILVKQKGAGATTFLAGTGVTLNVRAGLGSSTNGQHSLVSVLCDGPTEYTISGDLA